MCHEGLTDEQLPIICKSDGSVIALFKGDRTPSLAAIRNLQAHGDPFEGLPWAGLLEFVRDLIEWAYRGMIGGEKVGF